jgi:co-chaperonin GroES (HSP10)
MVRRKLGTKREVQDNEEIYVMRRSDIIGMIK